MSVHLWLHLLLTAAAIMVSVVIFFKPKGTSSHKQWGWVWVGIMGFLSLISFLMQEYDLGNFSVFHLLSLATLFGLAAAVYAARRGYRKTHAGIMITFAVVLVLSILDAFLQPGRLLNVWLMSLF